MIYPDFWQFIWSSQSPSKPISKVQNPYMLSCSHNLLQWPQQVSSHPGQLLMLVKLYKICFKLRILPSKSQSNMIIGLQGINNMAYLVNIPWLSISSFQVASLQINSAPILGCQAHPSIQSVHLPMLHFGSQVATLGHPSPQPLPQYSLFGTAPWVQPLVFRQCCLILYT